MPTKMPCFPRRPPGRLIGRLVVNVDDRVQLLRLEDAGGYAPSCFQALDLVALEGLDADDADLRVEFPQRAVDAHQRAGGAHRQHDKLTLPPVASQISRPVPS